MSKTLITGATGGLGSAVVDFLIQTKNISEISVLVRDPESEKAKDYASKGFEVRVGDYDDKASMIAAFQGIDYLYFVSGSDIGARMQQHQNVVEASVEAGVGHIIYTSAGRKDESEPAPLHPVMSAHIATENWIKASGLTYTLLQHNLYAGVIPMFLGGKEQVLATKTVYLPTGDGKTAFVSRVELAEGGAKVLSDPDKHANKIYAFNGSEAVSFAQVAQYLSDATGEIINYFSPEVAEFEATLKSVGLPAPIIGMTTMFSLGIADGEFDDTTNDLEVILGRKTKSMEAFVKEVYQ
ncbi:MAG: SDR family oxidoreductase [Bacteroidetes bacterium]|nr:SDR family oxidoreductase [Bacteroidota bacterium]